MIRSLNLKWLGDSQKEMHKYFMRLLVRNIINHVSYVYKSLSFMPLTFILITLFTKQDTTLKTRWILSWCWFLWLSSPSLSLQDRLCFIDDSKKDYSWDTSWLLNKIVQCLLHLLQFILHQCMVEDGDHALNQEHNCAVGIEDLKMFKQPRNGLLRSKKLFGQYFSSLFGNQFFTLIFVIPKFIFLPIIYF